MVDPDLWYLVGTTTREIRADLQALHLLSAAEPDDVHRTWAPVLGGLFGKLLLVTCMPPSWQAEVVSRDSPYLGPTRPPRGSAVDFLASTSATLADSERWQALWPQAGTAPPEAMALVQEIFGRERGLAAHGELMAGARR